MASPIPTLPSLSVFLNNLTHLDPSLTSETDYCTICRVPYAFNAPFSISGGLDLLDQETLSNLQTLSRLPFAYSIPRDQPVRLPCGHVFGLICLKEWFKTGANTCPLDRLALFRRGGGDGANRGGAGEGGEQVPFPTPEDYHKYLVAIQRVRRLPLRKLIVDFDTWGAEDTVRVSSLPMKGTLASFMLRVGFRIAGVDDVEVLRVWHGSRCHDDGEEDGDDEEGGIGGRSRLCSTANMSVWPGLVQPVGQTDGEYFSGLVRTLSDGVRLWGDGQFPLAVRILFRMEVRGMYEVLCQEVERRYQEVVRARVLYEGFWRAVVGTWEADGMGEDDDWAKRELFLKLVLRAWISEERMLGVIRSEMSEEFGQV